MKCPVCEKQIENTIRKCPNCGFEDLRIEFINENELEMWRTYVVYPCRFAYQTAVTQKKELEKKIQKELLSVKKINDEIQDVLNDINRVTASDKTLTFKELILNKNDGWVKNANVSYKNYYQCKNKDYTVCDLSNFVIDVIGDRMVANFFVKKTFDRFGDNSTFYVTFKWRIRDDYGIVVADGFWGNDKLLLGDITKASISVSGLDPSVEYVLDFVDD